MDCYIKSESIFNEDQTQDCMTLNNCEAKLNNYHVPDGFPTPPHSPVYAQLQPAMPNTSIQQQLSYSMEIPNWDSVCPYQGDAFDEDFTGMLSSTLAMQDINDIIFTTPFDTKLNNIQHHELPVLDFSDDDDDDSDHIVPSLGNLTHFDNTHTFSDLPSIMDTFRDTISGPGYYGYESESDSLSESSGASFTLPPPSPTCYSDECPSPSHVTRTHNYQRKTIVKDIHSIKKMSGGVSKRRPGRPRKVHRLDLEDSDGEGKNFRGRGRREGMKGNHLWEFIRDLLKNTTCCPKYIRWEDKEEGVFRFVNSEAVARMWGRKKNNPGMTYEKLSRAMRYYYKREILERVDGRRLVYKFGKNASGWKEAACLSNSETEMDVAL